MQLQAQAQAGQLPPGGLPPGLLSGHPGANPGAAALSNSLSLLGGIPTSLAQAGPNLPHPAFASLLAQKPGADGLAAAAAAAAAAKSREEADVKKSLEANGGKHQILIFIG